MRKRTPFLSVLLLVGLLPAWAIAQELPYREGPVVNVTQIRVKEGKFFDYWSFLENRWRPVMEEAKRQGIIVSYGVLTAEPRTPQDANLVLVITSPNMASFDGIDAKYAAIEQKMFGLSPQKAAAESGERDAVRTVLGSQLYRALEFK
jgi:hypothetical protein